MNGLKILDLEFEPVRLSFLHFLFLNLNLNVDIRDVEQIDCEIQEPYDASGSLPLRSGPGVWLSSSPSFGLRVGQASRPPLEPELVRPQERGPRPGIEGMNKRQGGERGLGRGRPGEEGIVDGDSVQSVLVQTSASHRSLKRKVYSR